MEHFTYDRQHGNKVSRSKPEEGAHFLSFETFCQLHAELDGMHFSHTQTEPARKQQVSLEALFRNPLFQRLIEGNLPMASLCGLTATSSSPLLSLIMKCSPDALEGMLEHLSLDDPLREKALHRLRQLRKEPPQDNKNDDELLPKNPDSQFYAKLKSMAETKFKSVSKLADYAGVSKQVISKINTDNRVSREVALQLAAALELNYEEANNFLALAGYTLRADNRREVIIGFVMQHPPYTLKDMEEALFLMGERCFLE